ncbi:MAG TPA: AAA family ATPase [Candidatus Paceibacterota bacterium]|nr:AAA family ATPase [Candidatus Paceibacterota bacterium]
MNTSILARLSAVIRGQEAALAAISSAAMRAARKLTLRAPRFLLLGPTGVGKTETALTLSKAVFGRDPWRLDMSEFQRPESLDVLLGNRNRDRGRLGDICRHADEGLLLLDEIEKAHPKILDLLLQILEPGHVSLALGERCDLSRFFIVCTSNIATGDLLDLRHSTQATVQRHVRREAEQVLRPEIVNRFDEVLLFGPLGYDTQIDIAHLHLESFVASLGEKGYRISVGPGVVECCMRVGFDRRYGARPLRRAIERLVGEAVVKSLTEGGRGHGVLSVDPTGKALVLEPATRGTEGRQP